MVPFILMAQANMARQVPLRARGVEDFIWGLPKISGEADPVTILGMKPQVGEERLRKRSFTTEAVVSMGVPPS